MSIEAMQKIELLLKEKSWSKKNEKGKRLYGFENDLLSALFSITFDGAHYQIIGTIVSKPNQKSLFFDSTMADAKSFDEKALGITQDIVEATEMIGREWNSVYGRQRVVDTVGKNTGFGVTYNVLTLETGLIRRYTNLDQVIKSDEYQLTPEYVAEEKERLELVQLREESRLRQAAAKQKSDQEIAEFTQHNDAKTAGRIKTVLMTQIMVKGVPMTRKDAVERLIKEGFHIGNTSEFGRVLINADDVFYGEKALTKIALDYATFLLAKLDDRHYSEVIIDILVKDYGWEYSKQHKTTIQKDVGGGDTEGSLNPTGSHIVFATFEGKARYLVLYSGWNEIFDLDCRDLVLYDAAKEFDAKTLAWAKSSN